MNNTTAARLPLFAVPRVSLRCWPVVQRNLMVWKKLALPSLLGNIAEPLIILVAFGYGLGALVGLVNDLPYILFLASGSICMSTMYAASFEAMYSAFSRMQIQKTWESILNAPIALDDVVFAEMCARRARHQPHADVAAGATTAISDRADLCRHRAGVQRAGQGLRLLHLLLHPCADTDDLPVGCVFPGRADASWLQHIAAVLPLSAAVELVRPLVIGQWPAHWARPLTVLLALLPLNVAAPAVLEFAL